VSRILKTILLSSSSIKSCNYFAKFSLIVFHLNQQIKISNEFSDKKDFEEYLKYVDLAQMRDVDKHWPAVIA
jgi:hypothetical protein